MEEKSIKWFDVATSPSTPSLSIVRKSYFKISTNYIRIMFSISYLLSRIKYSFSSPKWIIELKSIFYSAAHDEWKS